MTILYNNIGKDLSRVSMPVALNEPLSLLQRLSEELEYAELLDIANHTEDPYERMVRWAPRQRSSAVAAGKGDGGFNDGVSRCTWRRSPSLGMPGRLGGLATNPSTPFSEKPTRATEKTEASTTSASR